MKSKLMIAVVASAFFALGCEHEPNGSVDQENNAPSSTDISAMESAKIPHTSSSTSKAESPATAKDALQALQEGNKRFVEGRSMHPHESADYRSALLNEQHPFATVIACSDSRVTPVLIFDQGIGDLFVIRVAGNVVDEVVAGSIEYAVDHLNTKLLVVMGHENCGAVTAAYHAFVAKDQTEQEPKEISSLLTRIEPALRNLDRTKPEKELITQGIEENVREAIRQLLLIPDLHRAHQEDRLKIVGAIYSLKTGEVQLLEE